MSKHAPNGGKPTASRRSESIDAQFPTVTIHVVCRACSHEQLVRAQTRTAAIEQTKEAQLRHAIDSGHTETVPGVVDDPSCHVCGRIPLTTMVTGPETATHDCGHTPAEVEQ